MFRLSVYSGVFVLLLLETEKYIEETSKLCKISSTLKILQIAFHLRDKASGVRRNAQPNEQTDKRRQVKIRRCCSTCISIARSARFSKQEIELSARLSRISRLLPAGITAIRPFNALDRRERVRGLIAIDLYICRHPAEKARHSFPLA